MRTFVAILIVALAVTPVFAGENPNVRLFMSGSDVDYVDQIAVPAGVPFDMYLIADCLDTGLRAVAVTATHAIPGFPAGVPAYLLAGTNVIGGFNDPTGWAMAWADCEYPDPVTGFLVIARVPYFASGAGAVTLSAHPTQAYKAVGCDFIADQYCIFQNFGVGMAPSPGDEGCDCDPNPVEDSTWGSIKSLYR
jgi:hypothetical protein